MKKFSLYLKEPTNVGRYLQEGKLEHLEHLEDADFQFGWPGYSSGNKLGFKMKLKK